MKTLWTLLVIPCLFLFMGCEKENLTPQDLAIDTRAPACQPFQDNNVQLVNDVPVSGFCACTATPVDFLCSGIINGHFVVAGNCGIHFHGNLRLGGPGFDASGDEYTIEEHDLSFHHEGNGAFVGQTDYTAVITHLESGQTSTTSVVVTFHINPNGQVITDIGPIVEIGVCD